jgi:hypothetical protein
VKKKHKKPVEQAKAPYHRRYGVIWRPSQLGVPREPRTTRWPWQTSWSNDGGDDAPLSPHDRTIFRSILLGIVVVFLVLLILTALGR